MHILKLLLVYITLVSIYQCCSPAPGWQETPLAERANASQYVITGDVVAWSEIKFNSEQESPEDMKLWLGGNLIFYKSCFPLCSNGSILVDGFRSTAACGVERFEVGKRITIFAEESDIHEGLLVLNYIDIHDAAIEGELGLNEYTPLTCSELPQDCSKFEGVQGEIPSESESEESIPSESASEEYVPEESEESIPSESASEESIPSESASEESIPSESASEESIPSESESEEYVPEESEESIPSESASEESVPEESEESIPSESESEESSDHTSECEDNECPTGHTLPESSEDFCEQEAKECGDGVYVGRNPDNNCEYFNCLNSSNCIYGTLRFGGYCACWSGAFGKNCMMGSAKVGTEAGSFVHNAFSSNIRGIEDMYYKMDFDLMLGKSFLRNFTGHPTCSEKLEKVYALETNAVPTLDFAALINGSLNLKVSQNMIDGRADGAVFLNDDDIEGSGMHVDCYYPRSDYIEKAVEECRDVWEFSVPWNTAKNCGWRLSSEETHVVYKGQVIIHNMEWLQIKQWRIIRSVLRLKMRFQKFIRVECETSTFNEKILTAAITRQIVAIQLGQPALIELTTILNYPYKLSNGNLTKYPTENITKFEFSGVEDCAASEGDECVQTWRTNLYLSEETCRLDGDYAMTFTLRCAEGISDEECPSGADNQTVIDYRLKSEDFCAEISVDVGIYGFISCFIDNSYKEHRELFTVGQRAYFLVKINSDLNPRNQSGDLDVDHYNEDNAEIKFSSLNFNTITVRLESTDEVIRLFENGKPCPDVFGASLTIETSYGDGTKFGSNSIGFSFIMSRDLLQLNQNNRIKITVGAEIEAHFDDQTSKRWVLAEKTDRSTFSTSPEVEDDGDDHGPGSNAVTILASIFLMVLTFLF